MGSQMPELGSKISLISKADIRYEGRLFQVDPQECTIALANVRSYGTEDRETHYPVPAQSQVYEYILFRGSDIKDIRVINTAIHQDPAIVQLVPPVMNQQPPTMPAIGTSVLGQAGSNLGSFPNYGSTSAPGVGAGIGLQRAPGAHALQQSELPPVQSHTPSESVDKDSDLIGGVSRSTTPSLTRKSPTIDQGTQVNSSSPPREQAKKHPRPIQPPHRDRERDRDRDNNMRRDYQPRQSNQMYRDDLREPQQDRREMQDRRYHDNRGGGDGRGDFQYRRPNNNMRRDNMHPDGPNRINLIKLVPPPSYTRCSPLLLRPSPYINEFQQHRNYNNYRDPQQGGWIPRNHQMGYPPNQHHQLQQRQQNPHQQQRDGRPRGPPRPPRGGGANMGDRNAALQAGVGKNKLKFDDEYDFDKANTEFAEMRAQIGKLKVSTVAGSETKLETEKKEDSGNETGTGEPETGEEETFYDRKKSFFDSISCEAVERSKGRSQRTDWRTERKLNTETFGVSLSRRGMFRGRGYYGGPRNYGYRPRPRGSNPGGAIGQAASAEAPVTQKVPEQEVPTTETVEVENPEAAAVPSVPTQTLIEVS